MKDKQRILGLDLVRTTAISLVVISHITYLLWPTENGLLVNSLRALGAIGVDFFFILSGFLIGGIILKNITAGHYTLPHLYIFWKRRWLRTLPNYLVVLLVNLVVYLLMHNSLPPEIGKYFLFLQNITQEHPDFFSEAWSLSVEEYAYIILPGVLFLSLSYWPIKDKKRFFLLIVIVFIGLGFLSKIYYCKEAIVTTYTDWSHGFRKVVLYRIDSIYYGFLLAYLHRYTKLFTYKISSFLIGVIIIFGLHVVLFYNELVPQNALVFYSIIYLGGILVGLACLFPLAMSIRLQHKKIKSLIFYVSTRSYAIYLINYSLILLTLRELEWGRQIAPIFVVALFLLFTLLLSELLFRGVEQPILKFRNKKIVHA